MPIPPRSSQQLPGEGKLPPQPAAVLEALETKCIDVFSKHFNLPPPFAREAANHVHQNFLKIHLLLKWWW
jgi:hypothetical protein